MYAQITFTEIIVAFKYSVLIYYYCSCYKSKFSFCFVFLYISL